MNSIKEEAIEFFSREIELEIPSELIEYGKELSGFFKRFEYKGLVGGYSTTSKKKAWNLVHSEGVPYSDRGKLVDLLEGGGTLLYDRVDKKYRHTYSKPYIYPSICMSAIVSDVGEFSTGTDKCTMNIFEHSIMEAIILNRVFQENKMKMCGFDVILGKIVAVFCKTYGSHTKAYKFLKRLRGQAGLYSLVSLISKYHSEREGYWIESLFEDRYGGKVGFFYPVEETFRGVKYWCDFEVDSKKRQVNPTEGLLGIVKVSSPQEYNSTIKIVEASLIKGIESIDDVYVSDAQDTYVYRKNGKIITLPYDESANPLDLLTVNQKTIAKGYENGFHKYEDEVIKSKPIRSKRLPEHRTPSYWDEYYEVTPTKTFNFNRHCDRYKKNPSGYIKIDSGKRVLASNNDKKDVLYLHIKKEVSFSTDRKIEFIKNLVNSNGDSPSNTLEIIKNILTKL